MKKIIIFFILLSTSNSYAFNFRMNGCLGSDLKKDYNFTLDDYVYNYLEFNFLDKEISINWKYNPETYKKHSEKGDESGSVYFDLFFYKDDLIKGVDLEEDEIKRTITIFPKENRFEKTVTFVELERTLNIEYECLKTSKF